MRRGHVRRARSQGKGTLFLDEIGDIPLDLQPKLLRVWQDAKWVIGGPQGAAARLGLRCTTLLYRMEKLGIPRRPA